MALKAYACAVGLTAKDPGDLPDAAVTAICVLAYRATSVRTWVDDVPPRRPGLGDLVIETSTIYDRSRDRARLGILMEVKQVPAYGPEDYAEGEGPDQVPLKKVWVLKAGGTTTEWDNADFVVVPRDLP